jgi:hypothetical protein
MENLAKQTVAPLIWGRTTLSIWKIIKIALKRALSFFKAVSFERSIF